MSSANNLVKFVNGTSPLKVDIPEIETGADIYDYTKYGSKIKTATTSGGKTIGYYIDNNGVVQLTELDSTSNAKVSTKSALKVVEDGDLYKFEGVKETGTGALGTTIFSGVLGGVGIATTLNQVGIHLAHAYYGEDESKLPQFIKDQRLVKETIDRWNVGFEDSLVQGVIDASTNSVGSSLRHSKILGENQRNQGVLPILYDVGTNQCYAPEEMITDILSAIASAWNLNKITDLPTAEVGSITVNPFYPKEINYGTYQAKNIVLNDCFVIAYNYPLNNPTQTGIMVVSNSPTATYEYDSYEGESFLSHHSYTMINESSHTKNSKTVYFSLNIGMVGRATGVPLSTYTQDVDQGILNNNLSWYSIYSDPQLPNGTSTIPGETTLGIGDFMKLERATNQTEKHNFLRDKFPSWFSNAIESFYIDPDTYEKVGQWLWPFSPTGKFEQVEMPESSPWDMPLTENVPQSADGKAPLEDLENVLENVIDAMKGIVFNYNFNFDPVVNVPNVEGGRDGGRVPPEDTTPTDGKNRTGEGTTPLVVLPTGETGSTGLGGVYSCTKAEIGAVNSYLWSNEFWTIVEKMISNPMDAIIGLHQVYFTPTVNETPENIYCGCQDTHVSSHKVSERFYTIDCGHVKLNEHFGNVYDYDGTIVKIYLPYVGIVPLNVDDVMRSTLYVEYHIDVCSGSAICNITVERDGYKAILYTYGCNVASIYPLSGRDFTGLVSSVLNTAFGVATDNPVSAISGAVGIVTNSRGHVQQSGGYGGNTGAMAVKKPYIIIERCIPNNPTNYNLYRGYATNLTQSLSNCTGYTEVENLRLDTQNMLYEDIIEIENLLRVGVVL